MRLCTRSHPLLNSDRVIYWVVGGVLRSMCFLATAAAQPQTYPRANSPSSISRFLMKLVFCISPFMGGQTCPTADKTWPAWGRMPLRPGFVGREETVESSGQVQNSDRINCVRGMELIALESFTD